MAIKELQKTVVVTSPDIEKRVESFISKGGTLPSEIKDGKDDDSYHRLTLRIPKWLVDKIDLKRKCRSGKVSRSLWIIELLERSTKGS